MHLQLSTCYKANFTSPQQTQSITWQTFSGMFPLLPHISPSCLDNANIIECARVAIYRALKITLYRRYLGLVRAYIALNIARNLI